MQRRDTALVLRIRIRARPDQELNDGILRIGVPAVRPRNSVGRVVERFGAPSVSGGNVRTFRHKLLSDGWLVGRGSHVQRRITGVDVVGDLLEVGAGRFAGRTNRDCLSCEQRRLGQHPRCH